MANKFQPGDRFQAIEENSQGGHNTGSIIRISFNSIQQCDDYIVSWDHLPASSTLCYTAEEADKHWDFLPKKPKVLVGAKAKVFVNGVPVGEFANAEFTVNEKVPESNSHNCQDFKKWYPGFIHGYHYCEKCGEKIV